MTKQYDIVVLGAGESGVGAAILAHKKGLSVFVSDAGTIQDTYADTLRNYTIAFESNKHSTEIILHAHEIIKSPGIPDTQSLIQEALKENIPVISELEFAARYTNAKLICITGSNGKTTTTLLTYHILKQAGLNVGLAGNIGHSFAEQVATKNFDFYVIEISSFQLDNMYAFKADIAILLNITPDHLNRYDYSFQKYIESKFRILQNMKNNDCFIYCSDDETIIKEIHTKTIIPKQFTYSTQAKESQNGYLQDDTISIEMPKTEICTIKTHNMLLQGKHNYGNTMAAAISAKIVDIKNETIRKSLENFEGVEHRLEKLSYTIRGVEFINDSKATNVNSTWYALECMDDNVVWIAGGTDKGNDYSPLFELVEKKVKALICLGTDNTKLLKDFRGKTPIIVETNSMKDAVQAAYKLADKGNTVLLSPACASFDLFENYIERGIQFKEEVRNL
ncbi:MAG: UDP-N-acetylmuramoyl-L-alanine--D-glutamate ligase [Bacteroidales bacterium]|jgi:UDP-N-acetylmuramoylalanine--D-glutamate ligase|nr:UDP-N-acetylmuramoyl-L-alanine--D-glutamate ligase [Bacteroidales bacterium]